MAACGQGAETFRGGKAREYGVYRMTAIGRASLEVQGAFQRIKAFNRSPGVGIPLIQLNIKVGSAKTVKKGIPE